MCGLAACSPHRAAAQLGFGGGPATPVAGLAELVGAGVHAGLVADAGLPLLPLGVRLDLIFQRHPGYSGGADFQQVFATANGRFSPLPLPLSAYATAGLGLYASSFREESTSDGWATHNGVNAGAGLRLGLPAVTLFVEARYHRVRAAPQREFVPVTVGILF
jgi:hypothetical protein